MVDAKGTTEDVQGGGGAGQPEEQVAPPLEEMQGKAPREKTTAQT